MGRLNLKLDDQLEEQFRKKAYERFGYKLGSLNQALNEAVEKWLSMEDKPRRKPSAARRSHPSE